MAETTLLAKVKKNLILDSNADDDFIIDKIAAAIAYAEKFQHRPDGYYAEHPMPPTTEQAVIMHASHFYESRDGSTGGFFGDSPSAAKASMEAIDDLLRLDRDWKV